MPGLNGRGPMNEGPMTGRGLGRCRPAAAANLAQGPVQGSAVNSGDPLRRIDPNNYNPGPVADANVVYGRGRGGQPWGGGANQAFGRGFGGPGGGRGAGRGLGLGRGRGWRR